MLSNELGHLAICGLFDSHIDRDCTGVADILERAALGIVRVLGSHRWRLEA